MNELIIHENKNSYYEQVGPGNTSSVKQYNISGREITKNGFGLGFFDGAVIAFHQPGFALKLNRNSNVEHLMSSRTIANNLLG